MPSLGDYLSQLANDALDIMPLLAGALELESTDRPLDALTLYKAWLSFYPSHPMGQAALFNLGVLYDRLGHRDQSSLLLLRTIHFKPDFPPPYINLGNYLEAAGDRVGAAGLWTQLLAHLAAVTPEIIEQKLNALKLLARLFAAADLDGDAEIALHNIIEIDPHQADIMAYWLNMRQRQCHWDPACPPTRIPPSPRHRNNGAADPAVTQGRPALATRHRRRLHS